jgi:hypothetical protein
MLNVERTIRYEYPLAMAGALFPSLILVEWAHLQPVVASGVGACLAVMVFTFARIFRIRNVAQRTED